VADAGGSIATVKNGMWSSGLTSAAAQKGLAQFKAFQNTYSSIASRTAPLDTPDPNAVFGTGKTSVIFGNGNSEATILSTYPALKGKVGTFPLPSENHPGQASPTFLGGSDLGIAAKSKNMDLAKKFVAMITSKSVQINQLVKLDGHMPVTTKLLDEATPQVSKVLQAFYTAGKKSYSTPAAPGWATIETDQSVLAFFSEVAAGTSTPEQSAQTFSAHLTKALNANQ
jgi:N,N'-diacetylchitobiose transport system substrate-binding protein